MFENCKKGIKTKKNVILQFIDNSFCIIVQQIKAK